MLLDKDISTNNKVLYKIILITIFIHLNMVTLRNILKSSNTNYYSRFKHIESSVISIISNSRIFFPKYTNHDLKHLQNVEENIDNMLTEEVKKDLSNEEIFCLLSATWLHDIGMIPVNDEKEIYGNKTPNERNEYSDKVRSVHNIRSKCYVENKKEELNLDDFEADIIGKICKGHRQVDLAEYSDTYSKTKVRLSSLSAILRLADELDVTYKRENILSEEGIDEETKEEHYKIHKLVRTPIFDYENQIINIISIAYVDKDKKLLNGDKNKIQGELDDINSYLKKIGIDFNNVEIKCTMDKKYIKKKIILSITSENDIYSTIDEWIDKEDIDNCLEELRCDKIIKKKDGKYVLTNNIKLFKEIYKMFLNEWMEDFFFTEYVENMIKNTFNQMKENFGCNWTTEEQNLRIEMIKNTPTAFYLLLFADESLNNPLFDISANQNGNLLFDSVLSLGLFNDMYHYRNHFDFENFNEKYNKFKLFDENEVNECIVFCESLNGE